MKFASTLRGLFVCGALSACSSGHLASTSPPVGQRYAPPRAFSLCGGGSSSDIARACCSREFVDADGDGVPDRCEQLLAEKFAPIVYHSSDESNFPTNVDAFLRNSSLAFYDNACTPEMLGGIVRAPSQNDLIGHVASSCSPGPSVRSAGTRSLRKQRTFFLNDVLPEYRTGAPNTKDWTSYFHAYPNDVGGVTIQYWRMYAYNDAINNHGGDWEGLHLVLDNSLSPSKVRLLGHSGITEMPWSKLGKEDTHPRVFSEGGGHATRDSGEGIEARGCAEDTRCWIDMENHATFIRQETWPNGRVSWPNGNITRTGTMLNVGEKTNPMNGQSFVQYSGLWGSPGILYGTSGYWGPAFNETAMGADGFIAAWCAGMRGDIAHECYANEQSR
ncbi:MAG: hypothetical protein ABIP39_02325 [Polyangiaceae bacterium]